MFSNIKNIILLSVIVALSAISLYAVYKAKSLELKFLTCQLSLTEQNSALAIMKKQAEMQTQQQKKREEDALRQSLASKRQAAIIMDSVIPKDCNKAAEWAIQQAINLRQ